MYLYVCLYVAGAY